MINHSSKKKVYIDEGLFDRILQGDMDAYRELYELTYKPLYAFLLSLTQNSEDAKDLMQDTYIKISQSCHQYTKQGNPMAWIFKIAKNLFLMKVRNTKQTSDIDEVGYDIKVDFELAESVENRLFLKQLFEHISAEDQEIITLHVVAGLKNREIADILDMPVGTVLTRYHRAMKTLQKLVKE